MGMKCIGVDVGGTSLKMGIFETTGELLDKWEVKTRKEENGKYILPDVAASIREKVSAMGLDLKTDIAGAGLGVPGPVMPDGSVGLRKSGMEKCKSPEGAQCPAGWHSCKEWK